MYPNLPTGAKELKYVLSNCSIDFNEIHFLHKTGRGGVAYHTTVRFS